MCCLHPAVSVFGLSNSLMLMSTASGNSIAYDLVTSLWDYGLPQDSMGHFADFTTVRGKQMKLPAALC